MKKTAIILFLIVSGVILGFWTASVFSKENNYREKEEKKLCYNLKLNSKEERGEQWFYENGFSEDKDGNFISKEENSWMVWLSKLPKRVSFYGTGIDIKAIRFFENEKTQNLYVALDVSTLTRHEVDWLINGTEDRSGLKFIATVGDKELNYYASFFREGTIHCIFTRRKNNETYNNERISLTMGEKKGLNSTIFYTLEGVVDFTSPAGTWDTYLGENILN